MKYMQIAENSIWSGTSQTPDWRWLCDSLLWQVWHVL